MTSRRTKFAGDVSAGHADGAQHSDEPGARVREPDDADRGAPPLHHHPRRPDPGAAGGAGGRARHVSLAATPCEAGMMATL